MAGKYIALPKGISERIFDAAIRDFRGVLGDDAVLSTPERLAPYIKTMMPVPDSEHTLSAALMATTVEQIQKILTICNKYKIPLWTISTGKNLGYGSAAPAERGQVVLDLKRMNRILEVDKDLAYALVEPGVTYQQLYDYIKERNLGLWLSVPAPSAIAGPTGNTLDRGMGYTPYGEHFLFACGMEVVLANGDVLRTGMGSLPNSNTWQVFKWGYGPYLDGIFTQSNYGIVTKFGFWLMPAPPAYKPFVIRYPDEEDIVEIVEIMRPLRINGVIPNAAVIAHALYEAPVVARRSDYVTGPGSIPDAAVRKLVKDHNLGIWNVYAALYGTEEQIALNWKIVTQAFGRSGRGQILTQQDVGDDPAFAYRAALMRGDMNLQEFSLYNWRGGGGSMWFAPVSQARGSETLKQMSLTKQILAKHGLDYSGEFIVGMRDMHHIVDVLYDKTDPAQEKAAYQCFDELLTVFSAQGYGTYRVNSAFMDKVADTYGPVQRQVHKTLKKALDPNGILAPGKSGIR
ncbi:MAG: 4-cresol dehydrogenase (hydroxylating) [Nitrosospira multiformis]|jgi:4-cresol dehydrogenase (hydroxylating)|nr:4-cresol dehydrogenase (hydroxylating) [Nitrosospira multiformis]